MLPKNFPAKKLMRQIKAQRKLLTKEDELQLQHTRSTRTKKRRIKKVF